MHFETSSGPVIDLLIGFDVVFDSESHIWQRPNHVDISLNKMTLNQFTKELTFN